MVGVAKQKRKPKRNETNPCVLQVEDSISILNTGFKDFPHPGRGKKNLFSLVWEKPLNS
jgi:hypothetical protein